MNARSNTTGFVFLLLTVLVVSCAGRRARENALLPSTLSAWNNGVLRDTERGIADGLDGSILDAPRAEELRAKTRDMSVALRVVYNPGMIRAASWPELKPWAMRGVQDQLDDGEIGPNGAESLREQVRNFSDAIEILVREFPR